MKVAVGFDHAGVPFHEVVMDAVRAEGHEPVDVGTQDDYPDAARDVSRAVHAGDCARGIVVCGSGAGVAVAACKLPGIRAAVGHDTYTAAPCVRAYVTADFSGEERHVRRLAKIDVIEQEGFGD